MWIENVNWASASNNVWDCLLVSELAESLHVVDDDLSDENVRHTVRQLWEQGGAAQAQNTPQLLALRRCEPTQEYLLGQSSII